MSLFLALIFCLLGGWISRMCGGAWPRLPWGLDQWIYSIPYTLLVFEATDSVVLATIAGTCVMIGKRVGHGSGIDLGRSQKMEAPRNLLESLISNNFDEDTPYQRDVIFLAATGQAVTFLPALVVSFVSLPAALALAVSGALKGPAYMIGWATYPQGSGRGISGLNEATAIGEFLTGLFGYSGIVVACVIMGLWP